MYNDVTITRSCNWITKNPSRVTKRRRAWCDEIVDGTKVNVECPLACGKCDGRRIDIRSGPADDSAFDQEKFVDVLPMGKKGRNRGNTTRKKGDGTKKKKTRTPKVSFGTCFPPDGAANV